MTEISESSLIELAEGMDAYIKANMTIIETQAKRIAELEAGLSGLMRRLDDHFDGPGKDWKEQEIARVLLAKAKP